MQDKAGNTTWTAHTHVFTPALLPGILFVSGTNGANRASLQSSTAQSKSRLVRTSGATRVHTYSTMPIQLEEIFTHTDGHLLVIVS